MRRRWVTRDETPSRCSPRSAGSRSAWSAALIGERSAPSANGPASAQELARRVEELRDRDVERAVAEERLRIARDVHDITGHHLSAISLQAAGAGRTTSDPVARAAFERIHGLTSRGARSDPARARRAAGGVRARRRSRRPRGSSTWSSCSSPRAPPGSPSSLRVEGDAPPLSETVEVCAYRVVQESLTNVVRHAGARAVRVVVAYGARELRIAVDDDGVGGSGDACAGGGIEGHARAGRDRRRRASPPGRATAAAGRCARRCRSTEPAAVMSIRVVVADDQAISRQGLRMILESEPDIEVVGEAVDGLDALGQVERRAPDVVLIDIRMPRMDGLEATRRLRDARRRRGDRDHDLRPRRVRHRGAARRRRRLPRQGLAAGAHHRCRPRRRARRRADLARGHAPAARPVRLGRCPPAPATRASPS